MSVQQNRFTADGTLVHGSTVTKTVHLAARPQGFSNQSGCPGVSPSKGYLGVAVQTQQDFTYPFPITIRTPDIGGPSAGLAMTLGLLNTLSGGHLTAGKVVAATGTIDPDGAVGDVGGVAQKAVAVERAGATVFLVPGPELAAARSKATPSLHVYAVNTLAQALAVLGRLGGHVPAVPAGREPAPPPGPRLRAGPGERVSPPGGAQVVGFRRAPQRFVSPHAPRRGAAADVAAEPAGIRRR